MDPDVSNRVDCSERRRDSPGGGARYKLMSPAKLPITRSTCITIPPGLSPTSFLESPVLLSNIKAEPSPTTGSLFKPQALHANSSSYTERTIHQSLLDEKKSSEFEFRRSSSDISPQTFVPNQTTPSGSERSDPDECRGSAPSSILADDGYNWRKYGQKHVKGSEFPRSYYKCTHPNCEVKKVFERSHEGQITEIVYKGTHDHPKPQPSRRNSGGLVMPAHEERPDKCYGQDEKGSSLYNLSPPVEPNGNGDGGDLGMSNRNNDDVEDNDPFSKRRKVDGAMEITALVKQPIREPRVVVQTLSEVDILDDGYRWRKYGQKVVRGNPNPRFSYKAKEPINL
ncbi:WRKY domain-containing protein [Hirschfeldia incana]|nr:WRKY domain-containing protein [Hirschfeldia incana]